MRTTLILLFLLPAARAQVAAPPPELQLDPVYTKYVSADGYPIVSSAHVSDFALQEAAYLVNLMLAKRPDVKEAMVRSGSRLIVMAYNEFTTDVPEYAHMRPKDFWDARARGLGGSRTDPVCSCGEENLLAYPGDPYAAENILIHEFAHNIHLRGLVNVDPSFEVLILKWFAKKNHSPSGESAYQGRRGVDSPHPVPSPLVPRDPPQGG